MTQPLGYANGDATYQAAGRQIGIRKLVDCFFDIMASDPKYATIYDWHPIDKEMARDKLALFLCGWNAWPVHWAIRITLQNWSSTCCDSYASPRNAYGRLAWVNNKCFESNCE